MSFRILTAAAAGAAGTGLVLWLVARRSARRSDDGPPLVELARRYVWWERLGLTMLLLAIGLSWVMLLELSHVYPALPAQDGYRLTPHPLYLGALAFFIGNLLATGPTHLLYVYLLGERFAEFRAYQARKFGFDAVRWLLPFYLLLGSVTLAATVMVMDWYVVISGRGLIINDLPSSGQLQEYSYAELLQIRTAPQVQRADGDTLPGWTFVLQFADGRHWSSGSDPSRASPQQLQEIARFISQQSGLPWVEVEYLEAAEL